MANDTSSDSKDKLINNRSINRKFDLLDQKMNSMYKDTYISPYQRLAVWQSTVFVFSSTSTIPSSPL